VRYGAYEGVAGLKDEIGIAMGRSNYIASILVLLIPLSVAAGCLYRGAKRWLSIGSAMFMVAGLLCTMSRGAILAILLATILSLPLLVKGGVRMKHVALGLVLVLAVVALLPTDLLFTNVALFAYRLENPDWHREELIRATWHCFQDNPFLGVGPGQLTNAIARRLTAPAYGAENAHNLVLDSLAENGFLAGVALLAMVGVVLRRAWVAARNQSTALNVALWIGISAAVMHNMVEASFEGQQFQVVFWTVVALVGTRSGLERPAVAPAVQEFPA
jgi:O-antigen ligase